MSHNIYNIINNIIINIMIYHDTIILVLVFY